MREPGKLILIANLSPKERGQLADVLDCLSKSNVYKVLEQLFGDEFLTFLDVFQEDTFTVPTARAVLLRALYIKLYNDSATMSIESLAKKYKRKPEMVEKIIALIQRDLEQQDGDSNG